MTKQEQMIQKLIISDEKQNLLIEQQSQMLRDQEKRIQNIEKEPLKKYNSRKEVVIAAVCSGLGSTIVSIIIAAVLFFLK